MIIRRKTPTVFIGHVPLGGSHAIAIQSMTNTPTADIAKTILQIKQLADVGSELIRVTLNDEAAMRAIEEIIPLLRKQGYQTPIIGDFHYNGHLLLQKYPRAAKLLDKYRINPGNVGQTEHFSNIIQWAIKYRKPVRIGVNGGSLDQELLTTIKQKYLKVKKLQSSKEVIYEAMVQSALQSAKLAEKIGLSKNYIVLSVKMSDVQDTIAVYERLAKRCDYVLHLGLTEAGTGRKGIISSVSALAVLLQQGIGDTIRVSLTPQISHPRTDEIDCCKELLQALDLRHFKPAVISCPGCGRTANKYFERLAKEVENYVTQRHHIWQKRYPGINNLKIAVMGCIVNGPGESKHANIGLSLPGRGETKKAVVFTDGRLSKILCGNCIKQDFIKIIEHYIKTKYR
ncbi:MAG: flavodoxin-dependent (E)-4-hydroxy-3-methylbut-2-enyl-diphosphate synthase [Candidatus Omnitrophica bacterium]|nr:flavodoxin-dependent (E)-4-hydroxy-3-methylbut-2-enyl-diphosphate synthase [Candidatus Omnitrophota bacterium]